MEFNAPGPAYEEWVVRSALVPAKKARILAASPEMHSLSFESGWRDEGFGFGETERLGGVTAWVWARLHRNPVLRRSELRIRQDFLDYHCLRREGERYIHPIDGVPVLEASIREVGHLQESLHVRVHADYLRDFLAVRGWALFLQVVADRFAVATSEEELGASPVESVKIAKDTWQTLVVHPPGGIGGRFYVGRSSLYWNLAVTPYGKAKTDRSPWRWSFHEDSPTGEGPMFIVDEQGKKAPLDDDACPAYLYFRREVLRRYQDESGYLVNFHMRTWGLAAPVASEESVDVGINSAGLVNAFAPDLAKLRPAELYHWAAFSCPPSGEICHEMFQTRMLNNPPRSECVVELVATAIHRLDESFRKRFGNSLHDLRMPEYPANSKLNVGPLGYQISDVAELAKTLYEWAVDPLDIEALRKGLTSVGGKHERDWKQIKLLGEIIVTVSGRDSHVLLGPLHAVNELRIAVAHSLSGRAEEALAQLGCAGLETRNAWDSLVDQVVEALGGVADALGEQ